MNKVSGKESIICGTGASERSISVNNGTETIANPSPIVPCTSAAKLSFAALVQGTIGLGFAIVSVPLLTLIDRSLAPVPQMMLSLPLTLFMAYRERHALDIKGAAWVLGGRIPGAFLGLLVIGLASARALDAVIGSFVLAGTLILATRVHVRRTRVTELAAGLISGVTETLCAIGGPPIAL